MSDDLLDGLPDGTSRGAAEPTRLVGIDDRGYRVGQDNPNAKLTDHEVELMRELHEGGMAVREIARKFEISNSTACDIVNYKRRASYPVGWRRVKVVVNGHERLADRSLVKREDVRELL